MRVDQLDEFCLDLIERFVIQKEVYRIESESEITTRREQDGANQADGEKVDGRKSTKKAIGDQSCP